MKTENLVVGKYTHEYFNDLNRFQSLLCYFINYKYKLFIWTNPICLQRNFILRCVTEKVKLYGLKWKQRQHILMLLRT